MKSIEGCLDSLLKELDKSWGKEDKDRIPLDSENLLKNWIYPNRHEYFMTLIDELIKESHAFLLDKDKQYDSTLKYYEQRTIITIKGYYFVRRKKSYVRNKYWRIIKEGFKFSIPVLISLGTVIYTWVSNTKKDKYNEKVDNLQLSIDPLTKLSWRVDSLYHLYPYKEVEIPSLLDTTKVLDRHKSDSLP